jgi:hypothetical protein
MDQEALKTPGALQMIVNLLRGGAGLGQQQTQWRAMQIAPGRDIQIRAAEAGMSPEEYMAREQQMQQVQQPMR